MNTIGGQSSKDQNTFEFKQDWQNNMTNLAGLSGRPSMAASHGAIINAEMSLEQLKQACKARLA